MLTKLILSGRPFLRRGWIRDVMLPTLLPMQVLPARGRRTARVRWIAGSTDQIVRQEATGMSVRKIHDLLHPGRGGVPKIMLGIPLQMIKVLGPK